MGAARPALVALFLLAAVALAPRAGVPGPEPAAPPALVAPEAVVYGYLDALDRGDAAAAAAFVAPGAVVRLPGLATPVAGADRAGLESALAFSTAVVDVDWVGCDAPGAPAVTCRGRVDSAYARAVGIGGRVVPTTFVVEAGAIVSIEPFPAGLPDAARYCAWAQPGHGELFGADCEPVTTAGSAAGHRRLAAEFLAAGRRGIMERGG